MRIMKFTPGPALIAASLAIAPLAAAQEAATQPGYADFSFKRISATSGLPGKRITVQIDPEEQARRLAAPALPPPAVPIPRGGVDPALLPAPAGPSAYDWFWERVPPVLGAPAERYAQALAALSQGPDGTAVPAPRLQQLQDIADRHGAEILAATVGTEVSPALVLAVISVESAGRVNAVSGAGAMGLMQLIPATADRFGVIDITNPTDNIRGGVAYLDWLMREFDRDPLMVLAAYNAGENAVRSNGGVPPYPETRAYVPKVLAAWAVARGLCLTPPQLISDGCVFARKG